MTEEIDRQPLHTDQYLWRLSRAQIQGPGPFSVFAGYDRLLMVTEGGGILLDSEILKPLNVLKFSGDEAKQCELLAGEVWDLGLIYDRSKVAAEMIRLSPGETIEGRGDCQYLFALDEEGVVDGSRVPKSSTLKLEARTAFTIDSGHFVLVAVTYLREA